MKRLALLAFAAIAVQSAPTTVLAADLRIAKIDPSAGPCKSPGASTTAGERAYYALLAKRLDATVLTCPMADAKAAGAALAAGQVDLALLDPPAYEPVASSVRAILTVRTKGGLSRVPAVVAVKASTPAQRLSDLKGKTVVFGGGTPYAYTTPRQAIADQGAAPDFFAREHRAVDADAALADVRAGRADAVVLHVGAWERQCRGDKPGEDRCADLRQIWRGRPAAKAALAVRRDMPDRQRFRLIGVHVAMHLEAPVAFMAASGFSPAAEEFEAAEADALVHGTAAR